MRSLGVGWGLFGVAVLLVGCGGDGALPSNSGIGLNHTGVQLARNETKDVLVTVHQVPNEPGNVPSAFSVEGLPSGVTATFDPPTLTLNGMTDQSTVLHLTADRGATAITVPVTVRRTANGRHFDQSLKLKVVDFGVTIDLDKTSFEFGPGDTVDVRATVTRRGNSSGTAEVGLDGSLPDGVTWKVDRARILLDASHPSQTVRFTFDADADQTTSGDEKCYVKVLKGVNEDDSHDLEVKLTVPPPDEGSDEPSAVVRRSRGARSKQ